MGKLLPFLLLQLILVFFLYNSHAQNELFGGKRHRISITSGYGFEERISSNADYQYNVVFITARYHYNFFKKESFGIDLVAEGQYNLTEYAYDVVWIPEVKRGYEFGIHPGISFLKNFWEDELSVYAMIIIGPHYISGSLNRQASGFIFSDNFILGADFRLFRSWYFDISVGYRHISNANLKMPNDGINNILVSGGLMYVIDSRE
jgi:hypothetical protein